MSVWRFDSGDRQNTALDLDVGDESSCSGCCTGCLSWLSSIRERANQRNFVQTEEEFRRCIDFLGTVPLFRRVPRHQYPLVARALRPRRWQRGSTVFDYSNPADEFFLVAKGTALIQIHLKDRSFEEVLQAGDYFGERRAARNMHARSWHSKFVSNSDSNRSQPLESSSHRERPSLRGTNTTNGSDFGEEGLEITIVAGDGLETFSMPVQDFEDRLRNVIKFPKRLALAGGQFESQFGKSEGRKARTNNEKRFLAEAIRSNVNLRSLCSLKDELVHQLCAVAEQVPVKAGSVLAQRGEYGGAFHIVESGRIELQAGDDVDDGEPGHQPGEESADRLASTILHRMRRKDEFMHCLHETSGWDGRRSQDMATMSMAVPMLARQGTSGQYHQPRRRKSYVTPASVLDLNRVPTSSLDDSFLPLEPVGEMGTLPSSNGFGRGSPDNPLSPAASLITPSSSIRRQTDSDSPEGLAQSRVQSAVSREGSLRCSPLFHQDSALVGFPGTLEDGQPSGPSGLERPVTAVYLKGSSFGELEWLYNTARPASAVVMEDSVVWRITQAAFRRIARNKVQEKLEKVLNLLDQVAPLQALLSHEKLELAQSFNTVRFQQGEWIVSQGERQKLWYILVKGQCTVLTNPGSANGNQEAALLEEVHLGNLCPHQHFGERALLLDKPAEFSVQVTSEEGAVCLALDCKTFKELASIMRNDPIFRRAMVDDLQDFIKLKGDRNPHLRLVLERVGRQTSPGDGSLPNLESRGEVQFQRIGILGTGGFGTVSLERDPATNQTYALKAISKGYIMASESQVSVRREKEMMGVLDSPFVVKLFTTFKDSEYVYFLLEPMLGGDLHNLMHTEHELFEDPQQTALYVACICGALAHLHERHIAFRDLKPENVLLSSEGLAKLCDFGFATFVLGRAMTLCGTPEYVAPEVIRQGGYDRMVDWWALGVMTFELIDGDLPFGDTKGASEVKSVFRRITEGIKHVEFEFDHPEAEDFIRRLLEGRPNKRLGSGGAAEVECHPFLASIDIEGVGRGEVPMPYLPELDGDQDLRMFDEDFDPPPFIPYKDDGSGWDAGF